MVNGFDIVEELRKRENQNDHIYTIKDFYDTVPLPFHSLDENGCFIDINNLWLEILGYNRDEIIGRWFGDFLHPDDKSQFEVKFPEFKKHGTGKKFEFKIRHKDGHYLDVSINGKVIYNPDGSFKQTFCIFQDITDRKQIEKKISISNKKFKEIFNGVSDAIFLHSLPDLKIIEVNEETCKRFGYTKEEIKKLSVEDLSEGSTFSTNTPENQKLFEKFMSGVTITKEWLSKRKDGTTFWHEMTFKHIEIDGEKLVLAIGRDITERKETEEKLYVEKKNLENIFNSSPTAIIKTDKEGKIQEWSPASEKIFGWKSSEVIGKCNPTVPNEMIEIYLENIKKKLNNIEIKALTKDKKFVDISLSSVPLYDEEGMFNGALGTMTNISDQKNAEELLKESEEKNRQWIQNSPICTKIVDLDFNLQFMSDSGVKDLKIDDITKFYGQPYPLDFYPDSFKKPMVENLKKAKETGEVIKQVAYVTDIEGNKLWYNSTIVPVNDVYGELSYLMVASLEITKEKNAESELKNSCKDLKKKIEELEVFNELTVDREIKMVNLKKEINVLCERLGEKARYDT